MVLHLSEISQYSFTGPMQISAEKAYWLFQSYASGSKRLHLSGRIGGEGAACEAEIVAIDRELQLVVVELFEDGGTRSWCRPIPLRDATFHLSMLGEPDFHQWAEYPFHLVLVLEYPDATMLVFAEKLT
jgi:hypothetical protein